MFRNGFDKKLSDAGCRVELVAYRAPNQNAYVERFVQSIKQEVLSRFIVCGEAHYNYLIETWLEHYHTARPHQGLDNELIVRGPPPDSPPDGVVGKIVCESRLGGVIKSYRRAA